jgi:uncharacterized Zn finger protein (UPF0148 family)
MYCTTCGSQVPQGAAFCPSCGTKVVTAPAPTLRPSTSVRGPGRSDLGADLKATLEARRELGPDLEDDLVDSFLARLDDQINARVDERVARLAPKAAGGKHRGLHNLPEPALVVGGSMALAIPLIGAAGEMASVPIMVGVVLINLFYFLFRHK